MSENQISEENLIQNIVGYQNHVKKKKKIKKNQK